MGDCELDTLELLVDLGNDVGHGEAEPLVEGDCSITIGIHGGEHGLPLIWGQGGKAHSKPDVKRIIMIIAYNFDYINYIFSSNYQNFCFSR